MIKEHQQQGWQFIFMGANMDAVTEAENLGISGKHAVSYRNDSAGVVVNTEEFVNKLVLARI